MDALIETGQPAPDFSLPDLDGRPQRLSDYQGKIVLLNFWSAECPWAERADQDLSAHLRQWGERVTLLAIASNVNESAETLRHCAAERGLERVLVDAGHQIADLYQAQTTPHFYVIDAQGVLRYWGAYDDVTFRKRTPTNCYVCEAVEALLAGKNPAITHSLPYGCTIVRGV